MNLSEIRKDIILFKDETLKAVREMGKQLFEGIKQKSAELDSKIADIEIKLSKYKETNKRMYDIILEQKVFIEKIKILTDFKSKTETRLLSFDIKLNNFFSELVNFKSHYDKIIHENLTIPGIIGVSCKYETIADYIRDNINKIKLYHSEQEKMKTDVDLLKKTSENFEKELNGAIDVSVATCKIYTDARNNDIKNIFSKQIENLNNQLSCTKNNLEENIIKKDEIKTMIKTEIKNTKKEIMNIIEEKNNKKKSKGNKENDVNDKIKNDKMAINNDIKKELKEIKKNFNDFKNNMENQMTNTIKLIKNRESIKPNNIKNNIIVKSDKSNNNMEKSNNFNDSKKQNNLINSSNNNTDSYYKTLQNNESRYYNNVNKGIKKEKNNDQNQTNSIEETINFKIDGKSKPFILKSKEKSVEIKKASKENNNLKGVLLNPIYLDTEKNELNNIESKTPIRNKKNLLKTDIFSKNIIKSRNVTKYRTFSETKYNFSKKYNIGASNDINDEINLNQNKLYLNTKEPEKGKYENKRYALNLINPDKRKNQKYMLKKNDFEVNEGEDSLSNEEERLFLKAKKEKNENDNNNNIAIKLIKNKKQAIEEFNLNYVKQCYPTLNLYKNYYNKKMIENQEKEKLKEKITIPKKISPAFGRTAYTDLVKPNHSRNLKNYNGKVNIIIDNNLGKIIKEKKYFYTINNENIIHRPFGKDKRNQKREDNSNNLSV